MSCTNGQFKRFQLSSGHVKMQLAKQQRIARQQPAARNGRRRVTHLLLFTPLSVKGCCAVLELGGCPFVIGTAGDMLCWGRKCKAGATKGGALIACFLGSCSSFLHGTTAWMNVHHGMQRVLTERDSRQGPGILSQGHVYIQCTVHCLRVRQYVAYYSSWLQQASLQIMCVLSGVSADAL